MTRLRRVLVGLFCAGLLVSGCMPGGTLRPDTGSTQPPGGSKMDRDHNKIFDNLDKLLTTLDEKAPVDVVIMANPTANLMGVAQAAGLKVKQIYSVIPAIAASATKGQVAVLARHPEVKQIEYDDEVHALMDGASRYFGATAARVDFGVTGDRDGAATYSKDDVVVAVIDTGIDRNHVDLAGGKIIAWKDFINNRTEPYDDNGHGTHVSGTLAGTGAGNANYVGVAPGAALVGLKVLNQFGGGSLSNLLAGLDWVAAHKDEYNIRIMSMSLGTGSSSDGSDSISQAVNRLVESGVVAVIAAGNAGPSTYSVGSPGAADRAITVGAMADPIELGFGLASFSSRGPTQDGRTKPDVVAPGVEITAPRANSTNGYVANSGTSMATPFVAGVVALMLDANPNLTPEQIKQILHSTAIDWGPPGPDDDYGWGRLDGHAAIRTAGNRPAGNPPPVPAHRYLSGRIDASGGKAEHTIALTDINFPLNVTVIMPDWEGRADPDFDLTVYGPDGSEFSKSTGTVRQEQVAKRPVQTGTYRIEVKSYAGTGPYFIDISAGMAAFDRAPLVTVYDPAEDALLSGTYPVKVRASDDVSLAKVELQVDTGAWIDITGGFDGSDYRYLWDTTRVADGRHTIQARATDSGGRQAFDTRHVTIANQTATKYELVRTGQLTGSAREANVKVRVHETGYMDLRLGWSTNADLDFEVYAPDGTFVGRAYSLNNPEKLRVDTIRFGTGEYRIKVILYGGVDTAFTLTANGFRRQTYTGEVSAQKRDGIQGFPTAYPGRGQVQLSWNNASDLDFYVLDPQGKERARAYTVTNPEIADVVFDITGDWSVRINLYDGSGGPYTLSVFLPAAVLS